jgi:hypothetical protein
MSIARNRILAIVGAVGVAGGAALALAPTAQASATCTPTGYSRDGINLTAAIINPTAPVTQPVNATGCNIGVFVSAGHATVKAEVFGANYYGVAVVPVSSVQATVTVDHANIHDIGESPLNGDQHGVGIYFNGFAGRVNGTVSDTAVTNYQKGGIVANGPGTKATLVNNKVVGQGPVSYIAQNGIQVAYGATGNITNNTVSGNGYTGPGTYSAGILVYGDNDPRDAYDTNLHITNNMLVDNQYGIDAENWTDDGTGNYTPVASPTKNQIANNHITLNNAASTYTQSTGDPSYPDYAGIYDVGVGDTLNNNTITGYDGNSVLYQGSAPRQHNNRVR